MSIFTGSSPDIGVYEYGSEPTPEVSDYYVDATLGSDSNPGTLALPWQTISKVNSSSFSAGDTINFKCGETWREQLTVPSSGSVGNPIIIQSYGTGAQPIISGADIKTGWINDSTGGTATATPGGSNDDAERRSDSVLDLTAVYAGMGEIAGTYYSCGIRFRSLAVAQNATITEAHVSFRATHNDSGNTVNIQIKGENNVSPAEFSNIADYDARVRTSNAANWTPEPWTNGSNYNSANIASIITEITGKANWVSNSNLVLFFTDQTSNTGAWRQGYSYDGNATLCPQLSVTYSGTASSIWYITLAADPYQVYEDGSYLTRVTSKGSMTSGTWYYDSGATRLYIQCTDDADPATHTIEAGVRNRCIYVNNQDYITIDGIHCKNNKGAYAAIDVYDSDYVITQNCTVTNGSTRGIWYHYSSDHGQILDNTISIGYLHLDYSNIFGILIGTYGDSSSACSVVILRGNKISCSVSPTITSSGGIFAQYATTYEISDNEITAIGEQGLLVEYCTNGDVFDNLIHDIGGDLTATCGMDFSEDTTCSIHDNIVYNVTRASAAIDGVGIFIDVNSTGIDAYKNLVHDCDGTGIHFYQCDTSSAKQNIVYNCGKNAGQENQYTGICVGQSNTIQLYNNIIDIGNKYGIKLVGVADNTYSVTIKNNIVYGSTSYAIHVDSNSETGLVSDYNNFWFTSGSCGSYMGTACATFADWKSTSGQDSHSISANPMFEDVSGRDYHPTESSPGIDTGTDVSLTTDYDGETIPNGTAPDMGTYEYYAAETGPIAETPATVVDWLTNPDAETVVIAELFPSAEIEANWTWALTGGKTYTYETSWAEGEVISVSEGGTKYTRTYYTEKYNTADVEATASTFYYDRFSGMLYLHTSGNDSPATMVSGSYKYCILADFCVGFTNRQQAGHDICYEREEQLLDDPNLDNWNPSSSWLNDYSKISSGNTTVTKETTEVYDSDSYASVKVVCDANGQPGGFAQLVYIAPRRKVRFSIKYKNANSTGNVSFQIYNGNSNVYLNANGDWSTSSGYITAAANANWTNFETTFVTHANYGSYYFKAIASDTANMTTYFDYAEVAMHRQPMYYRPLLSDGSIPDAFAGVGGFLEDDMKYQTGTLSLIQDGWLWEKRDLYLWHNKPLKIKAGGIDFDYGDLLTFISATTRSPKFSDQGVEIGFADDRALKLGPITVDRLTTTAFPNMDADYAGQAYPVLFGEKHDILPVRIDNKKYLVSQTTFNGTNYPLSHINHVYKNGRELTLTTDYTVDLSAGTFTLTKKAKNAKITCSAGGISRDFETGSSSVYLSAHIWTILNICKNIDADDINLASLKSLKSSNIMPMGFWVADGSMPTLDVLSVFKKSALCKVYLDPSGKWNFPYYSTGRSTVGLPVFYDWDFQDEAEITEDTESCYREIIVKYYYSPDKGTFLEYAGENNPALWRHGINETAEIETALGESGDAELHADNLLAIIENPTGLFTTALPGRALTLRPMDRIVISKTVETPDDGIITVIDEAAYVILEVTKDIMQHKAKITAFKDL